MANINIFALGGQDENGKDLFVLEVENDIYVINCGIKFPIKDLWGIDGIIADTTYLEKRKDRIKGVFLTHAHDEAFAGIPWFLMNLKNINIYGSKVTIDIVANRISKYKIGHSDYKLIEIDKDTQIGKIKVKPFSVANSILGSNAYSFETKDGDVLFMSNLTNGDLGEFGKTDLNEIKRKCPNILALFLDSRKANYIGKSFNKSLINPYISKTFKEAKDDERIIVGAYDEEMYTLQEIIELANKHNRPVVFYGSAFDLLYKTVVKNNPKIQQPKKLISHQSLASHKNAVVLVTGIWSRIYERFVRVAQNNDVFLKLKETDNIIMITPPINGMEVAYSQALDQIAFISPKIQSISDKDFYKMRPTSDDIKEIVSVLRPQYFVPISSLFRYQAVANKFAVESKVAKNKTIHFTNGKILYFKDGELASQKSKIKEVGDVIIQGFGVGDISYEVIRERKVLSAGGVVSIACKINRKSKELILDDINIQLVGITAKSEIKQMSEKIKEVVIQKFDELEEFDYREIQNKIRKRVQKIVSRLVDKEPIVIITLYEI